MEQYIYAAAIAAWAPDIENPAAWQEYKAGKRSLHASTAAPALSFTEPLFRRRLSQLSKMTIQVVHDCLEQTEKQEAKQVFVTFRGEITRQESIHDMLIKEGMLLPAAFSLSVFNAPIALAAIACKLHSGYTAIIPSKGNFSAALLTACAPLLCGQQQHILFVYADEYIPDDYKGLYECENLPLAFAAMLSIKPEGHARKIPLPFARELTPIRLLQELL